MMHRIVVCQTRERSQAADTPMRHGSGTHVRQHVLSRVRQVSSMQRGLTGRTHTAIRRAGLDPAERVRSHHVHTIPRCIAVGGFRREDTTHFQTHPSTLMLGSGCLTAVTWWLSWHSPAMGCLQAHKSERTRIRTADVSVCTGSAG